jgi:C-terminal processing protease CtpA/Prc
MLATRRIRCPCAGFLLCLAQVAYASEAKVGLEIAVEGEGLFFNPVVTRINVTGVEPESLAARAGIVKGDEITSIEGQSVKGRRANELKAHMKFGPGENRTLIVRHADGRSVEVKLTKPGQ